MKLAIVCTMLKNFGRKGFYNSQELGLGRALREMGHTVVVYKGMSEREQAEDVQLGDGLTVHYLYMPHIGAHGYADTGRFDTDFDGMICFSDQQIFIRHIVRFCRKHNIVFVPYIGTTFSLYGRSLHGRVMNRVFSVTTLPLYRGMRLLAKTDSAKKELEALGIKAEQVTVAPVGIDTSVMKRDFLRYDKAALKREYGYAPEEVVLCNVARLEPDKRTLELLKLFHNVRGKKPFRLLIIGEGSLRGRIDEAIREYGLTEEVRIVDRVPYGEMWKIYRLADYYLNMSRTEIFGMAVMEAVIYRTSVAAIAALGPSITLKDMPGHALCETDEEIAAWITADYPAEELLAASSEKMSREFSWKRTAGIFADEVARQCMK